LANLPAVGNDAFVRSSLAPAQPWAVRDDPFSTYRQGFEVRTYRLCERVLMFHHFPAELGRADTLVRAMTFTYEPNPVATRLAAVTETGYVAAPTAQEPDRFLARPMPALAFQYTPVPTPAEIAALPVEIVEGRDLDAVAPAAYATGAQWVDLDGDGAAGLLVEHEGAWLYRRNASAANRPDPAQARVVARFEPAQAVAERPAGGFATAGAMLMDLAGDGQLDVVTMRPDTAGFNERTSDAGWSPFRPFETWPNVDPGDPNLHFLDLDADGVAEVMLTDDEALTWYAGLGETGFGPGNRVALAADEEHGPRLVLSDAVTAIYTADCSGDGTDDLVRIRNGEVCYWPNLGYGRFGPKVTMDHAPVFDSPDLFTQANLRLGDIDGSGPVDLVYLGGEGVRLYANQAGNGWGDPVPVPQFPATGPGDDVRVIDLLGHGTACLAWTTPAPVESGRAMRYVDLMAGTKPHLLAHYDNGAGLEVSLEYLPSTYFAEIDRANGQPWRTRLPFPVHCLSGITTRDLVRETRFTVTYTYHHGHFSGDEREFRGFGRVDTLDTETFARFSLDPAANVVEEALHQPPVLTKAWYHTGAVPEPGTSLLHQLRDEYYVNSMAAERVLPEPPLPDGLDPVEYRQAIRAFRGITLREEVYALDGSAAEPNPYTTSTSTFAVRRLQPRRDPAAAVFHVIPAEELAYGYERVPGDPRVSHSLVLDVDEIGSVRQGATVTYPRRVPNPALPAEVRQAQARRTV
ncbi:MAG TPA: toxin TcdB middle/N-terminal domain-containing protein, partial [Candidatus Nanopelagicales bacterium]|nr:toxin TcdB middle/N-terminal domain-containing protein [Candidatus Nanopelagicales bacterium]